MPTVFMIIMGLVIFIISTPYSTNKYSRTRIMAISWQLRIISVALVVSGICLIK